MINSQLQRFKRLIMFWLDVLFKPLESQDTKWIVVALLAGLFAGGLLHWGFFLDWFNNHFDIQDWHIHVGPYLDFLSKALKSGQFPLHADSPGMIPAQYLARQNRPFSPQILLLYFLNPATYVLVNVWILYSLGFLGLLLLRARYRLSFVSFLFMFLLFNLNGHIISHMAVGHYEWVAYFLLPFFVLLIMKMVEGEKTGWSWLLSMSLTMLAITLQGAAHFFIYCMSFLLLLALFQPRYFSVALKAIALSALLSMIRILPPALQYMDDSGIKYTGGFTSVYQVLLVFIAPNNQGSWERAYYLGLIGFVFTLYFGIIRSWTKDERYRPLYLPMLVMAFFSVGSIYLPLFNSNIPFLDSQRAPTRFLIIPLVFLITFASIQFQALLNSWDQNGWEKKVVVLFGQALMAYDLFYNSRVWSLNNYDISNRATDIIEVSVGNYADPPYIITLIIGFTCSIITLLVLVFFAYRESKQSH